MEEKIREEIERLTRRMKWKQEELDKAVQSFREAAATYSDYDIETFIPGKVEEIKRCRAAMSEMAEQKQMLEYLLR